MAITFLYGLATLMRGDKNGQSQGGGSPWSYRSIVQQSLNKCWPFPTYPSFARALLLWCNCWIFKKIPLTTFWRLSRRTKHSPSAGCVLLASIKNRNLNEILKAENWTMGSLAFKNTKNVKYLKSIRMHLYILAFALLGYCWFKIKLKGFQHS